MPLENIQWNVIAPKGFELSDNDGNPELIKQTIQKNYDRESSLSKASGHRQIQAQQAIVGLNMRRQRLYLDNSRDDADHIDNEQLRQAAAENPVLQQDQLNFRPQQLSQLLGGNTTADNAILQQIAGRLVQHQHTTEPAPQAIRFFLYNNCAFCAHHFVLSRDWTACSRVMLMVDREDGGHDRVAVLSDSPATRTWDFGDEAMRVE